MSPVLETSGAYPSAAAAAPVPAQSRVAWGAVIAGTVVAMVTSLALNLLGLGIGASTVEFTTEGGDAMSGLGVGSLIWMVVSSLLALFAGGWVAGRLCNVGRRIDGAMHGLVAFALVTLLTFYMLTTTVGAVLSGTTNAMGQMMYATGQAAATTATGQGQGQDPAIFNVQGQVEQRVDQWLRDNGIEPTSDDAARNISRAGVDYAQALLTTSNAQQQQQRREQFLGAIEQNTSLSRQDAERRVGQFQQEARQTWQQATQQAAEAGDAAATGVASFSFGSFVALLLGAAGAVAGAYLGYVPPRVSPGMRGSDFTGSSGGSTGAASVPHAGGGGSSRSGV